MFKFEGLTDQALQQELTLAIRAKDEANEAQDAIKLYEELLRIDALNNEIYTRSQRKANVLTLADRVFKT